MSRLTPAALVPVLVVVLAVVAWAASPQQDAVLERAADALEVAGVATIRTTVAQQGRGERYTSRFHVDFDHDVVVVEDPEPGVAERLVTPDRVYERLADGTWLELVDGAPPLFGQDVAAQLRSIDATVEQVGERRYRLTFEQLGARASGELVLDGQGTPERFVVTYDIAGRATVLTWEVLRTGGTLDAQPPADARRVGTAERDALVAGAR